MNTKKNRIVGLMSSPYTSAYTSATTVDDYIISLNKTITERESTINAMQSWHDYEKTRMAEQYESTIAGLKSQINEMHMKNDVRVTGEPLPKTTIPVATTVNYFKMVSLNPSATLQSMKDARVIRSTNAGYCGVGRYIVCCDDDANESEMRSFTNGVEVPDDDVSFGLNRRNTFFFNYDGPDDLDSLRAAAQTVFDGGNLERELWPHNN